MSFPILRFLVDIVTDESFVVDEQVVIPVQAALVFLAEEAADVAGFVVAIIFGMNFHGEASFVALEGEPSGIIRRLFPECPAERIDFPPGDSGYGIQTDELSVDIGSCRYIVFIGRLAAVGGETFAMKGFVKVALRASRT